MLRRESSESVSKLIDNFLIVHLLLSPFGEAARVPNITVALGTLAREHAPSQEQVVPDGLHTGVWAGDEVKSYKEDSAVTCHGAWGDCQRAKYPTREPHSRAPKEEPESTKL